MCATAVTKQAKISSSSGEGNLRDGVGISSCERARHDTSKSRISANFSTSTWTYNTPRLTARTATLQSHQKNITQFLAASLINLPRVALNFLQSALRRARQLTQDELFCHLPRIHRQYPICFPKSGEQSRRDANIIVRRDKKP